jgi:signal transduction histidine kinase/ActR/RegA family two-component response regulator
MAPSPQRQSAENAPSYRELRQLVTGFAAAFSALIIGVTALGYLQLRDNALRSVERRAQGYSHILSAHLERSMSAIDARLAQIALQSQRLGGPEGSTAQWQSVLQSAIAGATTIGSLSVTDRHGIIRHSTLPALVGQTRQDRFINQALARANGPELVSDAPMLSQVSGRVIQPFGRRLRDSRDRVVGAVVATFTPEALRNFYRSVDTDGGTLRIIHASGALVFEEPEAGAPMRLAPSDPVLASIGGGAQAGVVLGPLTQGGPRLVTSYSQAGSSGLIVAVSLNEYNALQSWRDDASTASFIVVGLLAGFWIAVFLILAQLRAREAAEQSLLEQSKRLADAQRLDSLGQLTGGVAHDFNNLLTIITNAADSLIDRVSAELRPRVDAILYAADNGAALIRQLLAFSRRQSLQIASVDLNSVVGSMEDMMRRTLGAQVDIQLSLSPALWRAYADRAQVESALLNLAINARDAMPGGGKLTIETRNAHLGAAYAALNEGVAPGEYVELAVSDCGVGMSREVLERALEPFFTTKEVGKGSGLGLSMVYGFARQSGGHLKIESEVGRGTHVRLYRPRAAAEASAAATRAETGEERHGSETVLIAEDDAQVRAQAASALSERGYTIIEAADGNQALALMRNGAAPQLLLTDIVMPGGLSGPELAEEAMRLNSRLKVLITSGAADAAVLRNGLAGAGARFLAKPYRGRDLAAAVRDLLDSK